MKHRIKVKVPGEKRGFLDIKKTVMETRTIEVDGKTYKKLKKEWEHRPYSIEEWCSIMIFLMMIKGLYRDRLFYKCTLSNSLAG